jgi:hypothetical protein
VQNWLNAISLIDELIVARELAPAGLRSGPKTGVAPNGESFGLQREQAPSPQMNLKGYFCVPSSCCKLAWVKLLPAGTLRVSHTLPPMVEP